MQIILIYISSLLFVFTYGCASKETLYENVYEGLKHREEIVHPSNDPIPAETPTYDEYQRERKKALEEDMAF